MQLVWQGDLSRGGSLARDLAPGWVSSEGRGSHRQGTLRRMRGVIRAGTAARSFRSYRCAMMSFMSLRTCSPERVNSRLAAYGWYFFYGTTAQGRVHR